MEGTTMVTLHVVRGTSPGELKIYLPEYLENISSDEDEFMQLIPFGVEDEDEPERTRTYLIIHPYLYAYGYFCAVEYLFDAKQTPDSLQNLYERLERIERSKDPSIKHYYNGELKLSIRLTDDEYTELRGKLLSDKEERNQRRPASS